MIAKEERRIYVLDTNVLIHDPHALNRFDEHDVVLPIVVLEEMDKIKRGFDELARNVREASRQLDELSEHCRDLEKGCPLPGGGCLFFELNHRALDVLPEALATGSADNRIIAVTMSLQQEHAEREVVLVSKDINLRIKARALGLVTEDYRSDRVVEDLDVLLTGRVELDDETWSAMGEGMTVEEIRKEEGGHGSNYHVQWPEEMELPNLNDFVVLPGDRQVALRCVSVDDERRVHLQDIHSYRTSRHAVWGVQARNLEQNIAMNLLMDANLDIVSILGLAGSGKTLLALASGLHQTLDMGIYDRILVTRATVPMGQDIGYLPGTEKEKMEPWMGAISDNLSLLLGDDFTGLGELGQYNIEVAALSFARGRTFTRTWLIVDEAQNLTPHQMKTLVTRMGEGSKIIILGNNAQIDTPYLTAHTNGLSMAVTRFVGWPYAGHITLRASERSRLAAKAAEVL
ncbi:MAG: PhoH family protein [Mariprofundaceae bacterium]|nr:PhoH family protein [Mariprofundaceae bacterium]